MSDPQFHTLDRLPPVSVEAEQGVLGCIMLDAREVMPQVIEKMRDDLDPFYDLRHEAIFDVFKELYDKNEPIDLIVLQQILRDRNQLEALGGMAYIAGLMNCAPSAAVVDHYITIVNDKAYLRKVIQKCTGVVARIYDGNCEAATLSEHLETEILKLTRERRVKGSRRESFQRVCDSLENSHKGVETVGVLKTGFPDLDRCMGGLHPGDQIVLAARPGLGKSTLAMNIAEFNAIECDNSVGYFSLEMSEDKLNKRTLASRTRIDLSIYKDSGFSVDYANKRISAALPNLIKAKIEIDFSPGISIMQLRARARQMAHKIGVKLIIVDMLQLVTGRSEKRTQEVGEVSRGLKALAGELSVPVISISSMNRDIEKTDNRRPRLSDLRESGDIESDADVVGFLWQPDQTAEKDGVVPTKLFIAKNRNGDTGELDLMFMKKFSRFETASKTSDVPS